MGDEKAFLQRCEEALESAKAMENPLIIHHYDCDGITSGSIVASWFEKKGKKYRIKNARKLDPGFINSIKGERSVIFVDLGSGSAFVDEMKNDVLIIDHHQPVAKGHLQANPHLFGFDGGSELSAAGCAFFVFRESADLGVVGAVGDIQHPLRSLNKRMLDTAVERNEVEVTVDLLLFGRNSRPLTQLLLYADGPYLPGLTGHEEECKKFLSEIGIELKIGEKWRAYGDLPLGEKKRLVSALADLLSLKISPEAAGKLTGEVFTLLNRPEGTELRDASEFSTLLNACGRNNRAELGVDVCLFRPGAYESARALLAEHRKNLRAGIEFAVKNSQDLGKFILIDGRGVIADSIIGVVAGMLFPGARNKPVLALSLEETGMEKSGGDFSRSGTSQASSTRNIKLSTRGTKKLVAEGLNLSKILSEVCGIVGGVGGGHNIAAGATIPNEKLDEFLREFAKRV